MPVNCSLAGLALLFALQCSSPGVIAGTSEIESQLAAVERDIALFRVRQEDFQTLEKILSANPKDSYAHFLLGRCFERNGLVDLASEQFDIASKLETSPEDILKRLKHHIEAGELSEAFQMRTFAWQNSPNDPNLILLQGLFLQENGVLDNAEAIYKTLLKRPDCPLGAATALATICMERKQWQQAAELADRDLKISPAYISAIMAKGQAQLYLGDVNGAISTWKTPLEEHPFNRRLNLLMYQAYRRAGKYEEALPCALRNLAGSDWISYFDDAKQRVKELLKVLPARVSDAIVVDVSKEIDKTHYAMKFHFYLAQVYFSLQRAKEAIVQNKIALSMGPEFQPNWFEQARIKEVLLGDYQGAAIDYKKAYDLQRSDYKTFLAYTRMRFRVKNSNRDLALKIKDALKSLNQRTTTSRRTPGKGLDTTHGTRSTSSL